MIKNIFVAVVIAVLFSSCSKLNSTLDMPSKMDEMIVQMNTMSTQIEKTNNGMNDTNEKVRLQAVATTLQNMKDPANRQALTPIPFDLLPYAEVFGKVIHADEMLLFMKNYIKRINEWQFSDAYPNLDQSDEKNAAIVAEFYHQKLGDFYMLSAISGFVEESTVQQMIDSDSIQGAYRKEIMAFLMLRAYFNSELMLKASVLNGELETTGSISKAIEYNEKFEKIAMFNFADFISIKITGFPTDSGINEALSLKLNRTDVAVNWNKIYSKAQTDFKVMSYSNNPNEISAQQNEYKSLLDKLSHKVDETKHLLQ